MMNNAAAKAKSSADKIMKSVSERRQKQKQTINNILTSGGARNPFLKSDGTLVNKHLDYEAMLNSTAISSDVKDMISAATGIERKKTTINLRPKSPNKLSEKESAELNGTSAKSPKSPSKKSSGRSSSTGNAIADTALKYLGTNYLWGGASPDGFDCSGLVQYVAKENGIDVSRTSQEQYRSGTAVSKDELEPGDLVFFEGYTNSSTNPGHVGIYIGDGKYVQAPKTGDKVKVSNLSGRGDYVGARRISGNK